jgi:hypothetical protein
MSTNPNDPRRDVHGNSTVTPVGGPPPKKTNWLPWILAGLGLLALLFLLSRCGRDETTATQTTTTQATPPVDTSGVAVQDPTVTGATAPAGVAAGAAAASGDMLEQMRAYLGSTEAAGRRFTFDNINFATNSAELPADAGTTTPASRRRCRPRPTHACGWKAMPTRAARRERTPNWGRSEPRPLRVR